MPPVSLMVECDDSAIRDVDRLWGLKMLPRPLVEQNQRRVTLSLRSRRELPLPLTGSVSESAKTPRCM